MEERTGNKKVKQILWKTQLMKSLKIAVAAVLAIGIAGELGLQYSATAGIITVLSIQNTKRETLQRARNRGLAFLCALILAAGCFWALDFTLWAFVVYLFLFALLCMQAGWLEAISMDSVLITHFLTEQSMAPEHILNEVLLFVIGTGLGFLVNLHLHREEAKFERLAAVVDELIKEILHRMSLWLLMEDKTAYGEDCFKRLAEAMEEAKLCAAANYNNALRTQDTYEIDYIRMREQQSVVLKEIYTNIKQIAYLPKQAKEVAALLGLIEKDYHKDNTVEGLLAELEMLFADMRKQKLPESREEFEARALLFYILMQLKNLLQIKRDFILSYAGKGLRNISEILYDDK
ncbi:MAG: hypothetical protein E7291_05695 [Lachnospiraceae bacterium]|nr:hypothetical protein [Lachnospiraceae bacterium]